MSHDDIKELFLLCDANNSGFIEKPELKTIIPNADNDTVERLLRELDCDGDDKISLQELEKGLHKLTSAFGGSPSDDNNNGDDLISDEESMERR